MNIQKKQIIGVVASIIFLLIFTISGVQKPWISFMVYLPIFLGIIFQEYIFSKSLTSILDLILYSVITGIAGLILLYVSEGFYSESFSGFLSFVIFVFLFWSIINHEKKYVPQIDVYFLFAQISLFIYYWKGIYEFIVFSVVLIIILIFHKYTRLNFIKLFMSIISSVIFIIFWGWYILSMFKRHDVLASGKTFVQIQDIFQVFGEFILLGMGLGFVFQNILLLMNYIPGKYTGFYGKNHRRLIKESNMIFLERFDDRYINIYIVIGVAIILMSTTLYFDSTRFISLELYIGLQLAFTSLACSFLPQYLKN